MYKFWLMVLIAIVMSMAWSQQSQVDECISDCNERYDVPTEYFQCTTDCRETYDEPYIEEETE